MNENLLNLERWNALTPSECETVARKLSRHLPPPWQFTEIRLCRGRQNSHNMAFFDWNGAAFALIPGGKATLGYDRDSPLVLNDEQFEEWLYSQKDAVELITFEKYMDKMMTPLRTVTIEPFLMEVGAKLFGIVENFEGVPVLKPINQSGNTYSVRQASHRHTLEIISQDGFRFPSSNEWEYACAAGSRTLWHWGNEYPLHCYPKMCQDWDLNLKPNAFGLNIAIYPYDWEFCAESQIMRGGDGGDSMYEKKGATMAWLSLASAFFKVEPIDDTEGQLGARLRRVYSIPGMN